MEDWRNGTYNHLVGKTLGSAVLVSRLSIDTSPEDISSFFRNFHLQGNGVTLLQDVSQTACNPSVVIEVISRPSGRTLMQNISSDGRSSNSSAPKRRSDQLVHFTESS